jgi:predicted TIM-barrel fold metal-dependent hydrolase
MDLADSNPLLLTDFLRLPETAGARILLLHCYPFEREAGYLAQGFRSVFLDVGLSVNYVGARSRALIARSYELAPFDKVLFSSDAYGPADLHYLGARLWRNGAAAVAGGFVDDGEWSLADAQHVLRLSARDNAMRAYPRLTSEVSP